ncbi:MAG: DUF2284 domain-containing protein [Desulfopila sp.]
MALGEVEKIVRHRFQHCQKLPVSAIVQSDEVRKLCERNSCGHYKKNWTCPPALPPLTELREQFAAFDTILVVYRVFKVKSSFDWKGMMASTTQMKKAIQDIHRELSLTLSPHDFRVLGLGSCDLCPTCSYPDNDPCRFPDEAIISLEACGIDVMRLMNDHGMKYYHGENTITLVGGILFHDSQQKPE